MRNESKNLDKPRLSELGASVWQTSSVYQTPVIGLMNWVVWELPGGDRHFNGYNITEYEGRVSSKIVEFDEETGTGTTRSGRKYKLLGISQQGHDGDYVWSRWCRINTVDAETVKDVSNEYESKEETIGE